MTTLTNSQADELQVLLVPSEPPQLTTFRHKSIAGYLTIAGHSKSAAALREDCGIGQSFDDATAKKYAGFLEKKWTSVVRLQKKVQRRHLPA